nr:uncharacterized protein LOC104266112 [Ciona intestinalis]|eukprot:XP_009859922.1 uncharacterized protein LOC104266112 [Ciona intestinalis]
MDDCDLEKLSAAPAKLSPKFNRNTTEYEATVPSSVEKVKVDCMTSDSGASYQVFGAGGEKSIPLLEGGVTEIRIEVSSEDGTVKNYLIRIKRLSASDASLNQLSLSVGKLMPPFSMGCFEYIATVPSITEEITVKPVAPDKKCSVVVSGSNESFTLPLQLGETRIVVAVGSVDGSKTQEYVVTVLRKQFPWPVTFKDPKLSMKYECPMLLTPMYNPVSIQGIDTELSMSQPCMDMLARRSKTNPFDETPLATDWRQLDSELDKEISNTVALSVYAYKGAKDEVKLRNLAKLATTSTNKPSTDLDVNKVTNTPWYKAEFESSNANNQSSWSHKVEVRNWEKRLQHMASGSNADVMLKEAEKHCKAYRSKLPKTPGDPSTYSEGQAPSDELQQACVLFAGAIKAKGKEAKNHLMLAHALEEQTLLDEMYGLATKEDEAIGAGLDKEAKDSSRLEECMAICKLRGVPPNAPLALQLKGIDEEYKALLESGQSGKADHVQMLYAWRSKQALQDEKSTLQRGDESKPLSQAYLKYMDAVTTDPNNHLCNLHLGRMLIERGDHKEAVERLQQAVGLKPTSAEARFLLGLALCMQDSGPGDRADEAINFLHEGLEQLLLRRQTEADTSVITPSSSTNLHAEDIFRLTNIQVIRGLHMLADNLKMKKIEGMRSSKDVYHCVCLHAGMALCSLYHRGPLFQQIEWLLLDAHYALLEIMISELLSDTVWIEQRCRYLSAMIRASTITRDNKLLSLQEKVSQKLVTLNPCNSESLYLLGMSQLMIYDNLALGVQDHQPLLEARQSLEASINLEGKPASGDVPPNIKEQKWWKKKEAAEKPKQEVKEASKVAPAARGGMRGRGRAAPAPARGAAARGRAASRATPARGRAAPARGGRGAATPTAASSNTKCEKDAASPQPVASTTPVVSATAPINRVTHHARLGLARALARTDDEKSNARTRYEEVIKMAPEIHDAYIELADLLVRLDPLAAVDIYCRFPSSGEEDSFDDAYISGEIVSILMKHEKYEDQRLVQHMVKWGRVMGIGVLEKYMGILDSKFKTEMLKNIYAGVHRKDIDDPDLAAFFKFKCWI